MPPTSWLSSQRKDYFTLQLFASDHPDNVVRLVKGYPALDLKVHESAGPRSTYRVLYGSFPTSDAARLAAQNLPATVLRETGSPLIRSFAELQSSPAPTN